MTAEHEGADLPELNETNAAPGTAMRPHNVTYTAKDIDEFLLRSGETADDYRQGDSLIVPPSMLLVQPMRIVHANFHYETGVHVSSTMNIVRLPKRGDTVTVAGSIGDLFERNGNKYVRLDVNILDAAGETLAEIQHVSIYKLRPRAAAR